MTDSRCPDCGRPFGPGVERAESMTGRAICADCRDRLTAASVGAALHADAPVAHAVATVGWFDRLRVRRRRRG